MPEGRPRWSRSLNSALCGTTYCIIAPHAPPRVVALFTTIPAPSSTPSSSSARARRCRPRAHLAARSRGRAARPGRAPAHAMPLHSRYQLPFASRPRPFPRDGTSAGQAVDGHEHRDEEQPDREHVEQQRPWGALAAIDAGGEDLAGGLDLRARRERALRDEARRRLLDRTRSGSRAS